jgi:DNA-binding beta-propeller fold protein YncE
LKKQYLFSFVLATLSFIAAKSLQEVGVENYYHQKATHFEKEDGYFDLVHPESVTNLPMGVNAFTDFVIMDSSHLICLDDQIGGVLVYDLITNQTQGYLPTGIDSKITEVSKVDSTIILVDEKMDVHFLLPPYDSTSITTESLKDKSWISSGMCLHESTKRLFFVAESDVENEIQNYFIYTFNLNHRKLNERPLFEIKQEDIELFAISNNIALPTSQINENGDTSGVFNFTPEVIAVHPKTNDIYVLSSADRSLVVYNQFGQVVNYTVLNQEIFVNPKAMTFYPNGDLLLTNSDLKNPSIVRIKWNKLFQSKANHGLIFGR